MATAVDVAAYILWRQGPMTAMKLEKLVYYSFAWHLVWEERQLFDENIQAWANGPVVREVDDRHRGRFRLNGPEDLADGDPEALTENEAETVDVVLQHYGSKSAHWLSELTHREDPWVEARERAGSNAGQRGGAVIDIDVIHRYYDGLTEQTAIEV